MADLVIGERVGWVCTDDTLYVAKLPDGPLMAMNETAAAIWGACQAGTSREGLIRDLAAHYDMPPSELAPEVDRFVVELLAVGILRER
ncbi:PqqD family protein [Calidifontibacter indicus]|uniref:Coenzyme PQQ synthesis protein D (PqqD) n=1 Tax=Calidifontibacter indicus TaxID=419650 RepID=A0A3D9ULP4_9MICO|nr:PqqD family protein [Calidifontibacter indicus]REF30362.1 coenzyme PQQ synthesis protein D (PqqD) [Calidifontibacter indicus]